MNLVTSYLTKNDCYKAGRKITVKGLMLHSVGCSQPKASAFMNQWNRAGVAVCVHGFIQPDGTVFQTLPWNDLRTPLTAICGYLELLESEEKSTLAAQYIGVINNRAVLLKQLTEELFRYSVIMTAEKDAVKETISLNELLEESIAESYAQFKQRHITPQIQMPESQVLRYLDRSALSRVFSNLLGNALKYSDGDLEVKLSELGEITFSNTASGLDEVQIGKLFDRFYTVEVAKKSTGLGLAITRTLVEQLNGTISAGIKTIDSVSVFCCRINTTTAIRYWN